MKKVFLILAILLANSVLTSCTDLEKDLENEIINFETLTTGGEAEHLEDDDD